MLHREFAKADGTVVSAIDWLSRTTGTKHAGGYLVNMFDTEKDAKAAFLAKEADALAGGLVETERSVSRRIFVHTKMGKVWIVHLEGNALHVRFGRDRRGYFAQAGDQGGQKVSTPFPDAEKARTAYHKLIEEKPKKGYTEFGPRPTAYSKPPRVAKSPAAKSPAAKKSVAKKATKKVAKRKA